ncbi:unnamed protein product [Dicrocoelium dendriticum]|nr:unnamed protein product [Dicrocoelium dendriticum]
MVGCSLAEYSCGERSPSCILLSLIAKHFYPTNSFIVAKHHINPCSVAIEFIVSFHKLGIKERLYVKNQESIICNKLKDLSSEIIQSCNKINKVTENHLAAYVLIRPTEVSVYEAQLQLMLQLNSWKPGRCLFNVVPEPIHKGY